MQIDSLPQPAYEGTIDINDLEVDGKNPNEMDSEVYDILRERIDKRGWVGNAIVTDTDGLIADGEHRWRAAMELGLEEVPVKQYELSDEERRLLRQELNKIRGNHDPDRDMDEFEAIIASDVGDDLAELIEAVDEDADETFEMLADDTDQALGTAEFEEFEEYDEDIADDMDTVTCPECDHEFYP